MHTFDDAEAVESSGGESEAEDSWVPATDDYDDGEECRDEDFSIIVWCALCGHRPRADHDFRCRLHDSALLNASTRPELPPSQPSDEAAEAMSTEEWVQAMAVVADQMDAYKRAMDRWEPQWVAEPPSAPQQPLSGDDTRYPLPCVRCSGSTLLVGSKEAMGYRVSLERLQQNTPWLPDAYMESAREAFGALGSVKTSTGHHGVCSRCQLVISINAGSEE